MAIVQAVHRKNTSGAFLGTANGVADLGSGLNFPKDRWILPEVPFQRIDPILIVGVIRQKLG